MMFDPQYQYNLQEITDKKTKKKLLKAVEDLEVCPNCGRPGVWKRTSGGVRCKWCKFIATPDKYGPAVRRMATAHQRYLYEERM